MAKRKTFVPPFPYDKDTDTITLPPEKERAIRRLISAGKKVEAVKKVLNLTGAGLKASKDYVDDLVEAKG